MRVLFERSHYAKINEKVRKDNDVKVKVNGEEFLHRLNGFFRSIIICLV